MPALPLRQQLLSDAFTYGRRLQEARRQTQIQDLSTSDEDLPDTGDEQRLDTDSDSLSTLSSLSSQGSEMSGFDTDIDMDSSSISSDDDETHIRRLHTLQKHIHSLHHTRVLGPNRVHKVSQLDLVLRLYKNDDPKRFRRNLRVSSTTFDRLVGKVKDHPVFMSTGRVPQMPVAKQFAIALFRFGHFGNSASVESVAQWAGVAAGHVTKCTRRVMTAFACLHDEAIRWPTSEEKEAAKASVEAVSCVAWRNGYEMVDGTLVPLADKPGFHGEAYFDRKSNYSLNVQLITLPNLQIIDYVIGHCGSAHDSTAFQDSQAYKRHHRLFCNGEWLWADSAYPVESWCITPYKRPAADLDENCQFNFWVSHVRIRSEHAVGYLKGRFQSLRGLRQQIKDERDHRLAVEWIRTCLIIHALIHQIEASERDRDMEYEEELIELGCSSSSDDDDERVTHDRGAGRQTAGNSKRCEVKEALFASGLVE